MGGSGVQAFGAGVMLGAASIFSIGPNTVMLVREGLARGRVRLVAGLVWSSQAGLLVASLILAGSIATALSPFRTTLSWLAFSAVSWFAFLSLRAAFRPGAGGAQAGSQTETAIGCVRRVSSVVWLNPLTYIEMLLIPSALCQALPEPGPRLLFVMGLIIMTTISSFGYSFGASACAPLFTHRRSLQIFDLASGILLIGVALVMVARLVPGS